MSLLKKLYLGSSQQALEAIVSSLDTNGYASVSFLYFANCMKARLFETQQEPWQTTYKASLESMDFLLADGIALQLFYRFSKLGNGKRMPENLNGTDFVPFLLDALVEKSKNMHIAVHTMYDPRIGKTRDINALAVEAFEKRFGVGVSYLQEGLYEKRMEEPFDKKAYKESLSGGTYEYKIVLLCTGTPAQETWTYENRDFIQENGLLVLNVGGLLDYIAGFEKRAPERVVKARVLETPWRILQNPKKNFHKFASMFGIVRYWWGLLLKK